MLCTLFMVFPQLILVCDRIVRDSAIGQCEGTDFAKEYQHQSSTQYYTGRSGPITDKYTKIGLEIFMK